MWEVNKHHQWWQRVTEHATFAIPEGGDAIKGGPDGNWEIVLQEPQF